MKLSTEMLCNKETIRKRLILIYNTPSTTSLRLLNFITQNYVLERLIFK